MITYLPNSTYNCTTMLGLYIHAELASSRCNAKEKEGGIHRQKLDGCGSHIVYLAMCHMRKQQTETRCTVVRCTECYTEGRGVATAQHRKRQLLL